MNRPFVSARDGRFHYGHEAVAFIEATNCAHGCAVPSAASRAQGPGGDCPVLARVALGDGGSVPELTDGGSWMRCEQRTPLEEDAEEPPVQTETLFDIGSAS